MKYHFIIIINCHNVSVRISDTAAKQKVLFCELIIEYRLNGTKLHTTEPWLYECKMTAVTEL